MQRKENHQFAEGYLSNYKRSNKSGESPRSAKENYCTSLQFTYPNKRYPAKVNAAGCFVSQTSTQNTSQRNGQKSTYTHDYWKWNISVRSKDNPGGIAEETHTNQIEWNERKEKIATKIEYNECILNDSRVLISSKKK